MSRISGGAPAGYLEAARGRRAEDGLGRRVKTASREALPHRLPEISISLQAALVE